MTIEHTLELKLFENNMIQFQCDYNEGAHPEIMKHLLDTNMEQTVGYGMDQHCENARKAIKEACKAPNSEVHFLVGGTQTNTTVIAATLRPYQGVICAHTGHINVHETGAIEHTGHKVLALPGENGKITAAQVENAIKSHFEDADAEHIVQPGMVYISFPTEIGTIYTKKELTELSQVCRSYKLPLFLDGARLGYGLTSPSCDITLPELAALVDVFYIGGTKVGALFGEAVVISNKEINKNFRYHIKQQGGMLAKGRLLGVQFETLFTNNLYFQISEHANKMAMKIRQAFMEKGCEFMVDSPTNQQFPILTNAMMEKLKEKYMYSVWQKIDEEHTGVRFCTSWATKEENVDALVQDIKNL